MFSAKLPSKRLNMSLFLFNIIQTYNIISYYCLHVKEHSVAEYGCGVVAIHVAQHKVPTYFGRPYYFYKNIEINRGIIINYYVRYKCCYIINILTIPKSQLKGKKQTSIFVIKASY